SLPTDLTKATATADKIAALSGRGGVPLKVSSSGKELIATNGTVGGSTLADDSDFKAAMSGMPSKLLLVGYANIQRAELAAARSGPITDNLRHLGGAAFGVGLDGSTPIFVAKLVIK